MKVFVSNQLTELAQILRQKICLDTLHPLEDQWVIVPDKEVKLDLHLKWLEASDVVTGMRTMTYNELIRKIFPDIPSQMELTLRIEKAVTQMQMEKALLPFLQGSPPLRRLDFAEQLSFLFLKYLQKPAHLLTDWLNKTGWQQTLWKAVFGQTLPIDTPLPLKGRYYFYHIEKIAPYEWKAFSQMDTHWFLFSPSEMYLGDFYTEREQLFILRKAQESVRQELQRYFHQDSPLLSNWAVTARELFHFFEEVETEERFVKPAANSALHQLQLEWLTFEKASHSTTDSSIQLHSAPNLLREVEVVWEIIQRLPHEPRDILVLAPDIQPYVAAIEWVFKARGSVFEYTMMGLEAKTHSLFLQGIEILISLPKHRYSRTLFEKLLQLPPFLNRFNLKLEEAEILQKWMKETHLRYDLAGSEGSWKMALKRAIESMAVMQENPPIYFDCTQVSLLNRWIEIFLKIEQMMLPVEDQKERSGPEWADWIEELLDMFFIDEEERDVINTILITLRSERLMPDHKMLYPTIERFLLSTLSSRTASLHRNTPQAVRFTSIQPGSVTSAKTIILMGMAEGAFPRLDPSSSLPAFSLPNRTEEDRYLFLEAIAHAQEHLIITYPRCHADDGKEVHPSSLVGELEKDRKALLTFHHPVSALDPSYYQSNAFQSLSRFHYQLLEKEPLDQKPKWEPLASPPPKNNIDLRLFRKLARHPVQFFFEESLGIQLTREETDSEFLLSPLEMYRLRLASTQLGIDELIKTVESQGKLPVGAFRAAAIQSIEQEISSYREALDKIQVDRSSIFSLELSPHCRELIQISSDRWIAPPLTIPFPEGESRVIYGTIEGLTRQGLLYHGENSLEDLLKIWPIFCTAQAVLGEQWSTLFLTKTPSSREIKIENPLEGVRRYLEYLNRNLRSPSPLLPAWGRRLLIKGEIPEKSDDPVIEWARGRNLLPPAEKWASEWRSYLQEVVRELL